jgi:hypothetical protein
MQSKIAWDFQQNIPDEEHAGGKAELSRGQAKILGHAAWSSIGDRRAIEKVDEKHQADEWYDPP